ncbi:MAG: FAD-dependent monooxygenase [Candidatus Sumerlaeia bacterium]|nr:FAD-dependent monooxygenase [Candidatus Sumerlaeia bacterium]
MNLASRKAFDVLVVGAGPVGLFAALGLARAGAAVAVIEKEKRTKLHSYALALHASTLRLLDEAGLADALVARGHRIDRVAFYEGPERRAELDLSAVGGKFPHLLVLPQSDLEYALLEALAQAGVKPHWNRELVELRPDVGSVGAEIADIEEVTGGYPIMHSSRMRARTRPVQASFAIGADGHHSLVRRLIRGGFEPLGPPTAYVILEFLARAAAPESEVRIVLDGPTTSVLWPMGAGRFRWTLQIDPAAPPADTAAILALARSRAPWFRAKPTETPWTTAVAFDRRLSNLLGVGRVWLAGDAAHATEPIGVQSMNAGLHEAHDLAAALNRLRTEAKGADLLERYRDRTRATWHRLLGLAPLPTGGWSTPWLATHAPRLLPCLPATGEDLDALLAQWRG